ncbi:MAG: class I SAM-dependent methyltransferase [Anaerolineae bacterium]|nr:class I SAM-dependent methyltransferase [Anaerolineae bacterium]
MSASHHHAAADQAGPVTDGKLIRWAHRYDMVVKLLTLGLDRTLRERTADLAQIRPGDSVLDVGCGTGDLTLVAKARAGSDGWVCGIDAAPEMIEVARAKALKQGREIDFRVEAIERLPFDDDSFDVALSSMMMHHLPDDLKRAGLREVYRVLKPGGRLLVVDFRRGTTLHDHLSPVNLIHPHVSAGIDGLPTLVKAAGFSQVETGSTGFFPMVGYVRGEVSR